MPPVPTPRLLGCHLSIAKGFPGAIDEAEDLGNNALQLFTHNASQWRMKPITPERAVAFIERRAVSTVDYVVAHTMYLLNLASPDDALYERSIEGLEMELARAAVLELDAVVTHLGAHVGSGRSRGIERIIAALRRVLADERRPMLLLENTAGSGTTLGRSFEDLQRILEGIEAPGRVGVCIDTAHAFAAGYDLRSAEAVEETLRTFDAAVGLDRLALIHLNDSKYALGDRRDRHQHIGWGEIGSEGIAALLRQPSLQRVPIILETPKEVDGRKDADRMNLAHVRALMQGCPVDQEKRARP